ncbi:methyltransferase family protein [Burkholderiales bacterium JOSHI_001]|nr:methyltransferase family protein [Burkholderiales bacterium JOSHI_001]
MDYAALYDAHPEYAARRDATSFERQQVDLEVRHFKLPHLVALLQGEGLTSVVEIGCATGELIAAFPLAEGGRRLGLDISAQNIAAARERFPEVDFQAGDFRHLALPTFDAVVLSDVLEHVPDDAGFLADAAKLAPRVLVNLPLEDNWTNRGRAYGPGDPSGHLRAYSLAEGLDLVQRAGLKPLNWQQVWIHETPAEGLRRDLRARHFGQAYAGGALGRRVRQAVFATARAIQPLGRALFASNLFVLAGRP